VIHLVSKVTGHLHEKSQHHASSRRYFSRNIKWSTKTQSYALIEEYEKQIVIFYGGAIGFMDFEGNFNHAIMIELS
jgi:anthranilate synthase component 1